MQATEKQIRYVKILLGKNGMDTRFVGSDWKQFGAKMKERSGKVDDISFDLAGKVIDALK